MPTSESLIETFVLGSFSWLRLLRSTALIYIIVTVVLYFIVDGMIFLPPPAGYRDTPDILKISVTEGQFISAYYLNNPEIDSVIMFIHGNAEDIGHIRPLMEELHSWGFNVFAYDYRGYGTSHGKASERNAYEDAEAAYRYLSDTLTISSGNIIVFGRSVGCGSAVDLASRHAVGGLILEAPFTSIFRVVIPFPLFPFDKFTNLRKISRVHCPILVMHGGSDNVIPIQHGKKLFDAAHEPKRSLWVEHAGHNNFADVAGSQYRKAIVDFQELVKNNHQEAPKIPLNPAH